MITDYLLEALSGRQMDILNVAYDNKFPGCKVVAVKHGAEKLMKSKVSWGKDELLIKGPSNHLFCETSIPPETYG